MKLQHFTIALVSLLLISPAHAQEKSDGDLKIAERPEFRLPRIRTPEDVDSLTYLSEEEKALALGNLKTIPLSDGWAIVGNDPELQAFWHLMEREYIALSEGDMQAVPFGHMNLMALETSRLAGSDYIFGLFSALTVRQLEPYDMSLQDARKLALLDFPKSELWTDEERLVLEFTRATLENRMTDELFAHALDSWGEKKLLRSIGWISFVNMHSMVANVTNMKFYPEMLPPGRGAPPQLVDKLRALAQKTRMQLREFVQEVDHVPTPEQATVPVDGE